MNIFSFIKSQIAILDVIQEYATLKRFGAYWKGCCPFHHEKTASFTISPHKAIFYCFGCHVTGDVISFIEKVEHCSPLEAAHHLAERFGIVIPETLVKEANTLPTQQAKELYFNICKIVSEWTHERLLKNTQALEHLSQRGFALKTIIDFNLGYFPGGNQAIKLLLEHMRTRNILAQDLLEAQILHQGKGALYSPFEERIVFPIKDHLGRFCGFGGRVFKPNDDRPRYYNSKENEFFTKGSLLFGLDTAKKTMQETSTVFLVEGYTDCMAMAQHKFSNTVATLGTACTLQHLKTIARYVEQVYLVYDGDNAGQQAVARLAQLCWHVDLELKVIELPEGHDPASWLEHNALEPLIRTAKDIFLFFIDKLGTNFALKPIAEKIRVTRTVIDLIREIDDPLKQDFLLQKAAAVFEMPFQSLKRELSRSRKTFIPSDHEEQASASTPEATTPQSLGQEATALEKQLFCAILNNMALMHNFNINYVFDYVSEPLKAILYKLHSQYLSNPLVTFNEFFYLLETHEKQLVGRLSLEPGDCGDELSFKQILLQLQKIHWKKIVRDIKKQIADANLAGNSEQVAQLMQNFLSLKKQIMPHTI